MNEAKRKECPVDRVVVRRVVCAANMDKYTGQIIIGVRHWDEHMMNQAKFAQGFRYCAGEEVFEGFIDQFGKFMTRREAWKVAESAGQIIRRVGGDTSGGGTLYSENLY